MRIQMVVRISGSRNGVDWPQVGGVFDVPEVEAHDLISAGIARVPVRSVETATARTPETATRKGLTKKDI